jgi:actin-related protein 6
MVNGDLEKTIWDYTFGKSCLDIEPTETNILITEPQFNFKFLQEVTCELLFEEYEFNAVARFNGIRLLQKRNLFKSMYGWVE